MVIIMIENIKNSLVSGKKDIFNCVVKVSNRNFQLAGVGKSALKVKLNSPKSFPHLDVSAFLSWEDYEEFTPQEKALVQAFIDELP